MRKIQGLNELSVLIISDYLVRETIKSNNIFWGPSTHFLSDKIVLLS